MILAAESVLRTARRPRGHDGARVWHTLAKLLAGCAAAAYVHYPAVSQDMLDALDTPAFNNSKRCGGHASRPCITDARQSIRVVRPAPRRRHGELVVDARPHLSVWGRGAMCASAACGAMKGILEKRTGKLTYCPWRSSGPRRTR